MSIFDTVRRLLGSPAATPRPSMPAAPGHPATPLTPAAPSKPAAPERRRAERTDASPGLRVLIIDDSSTIVAVLGRMLRQNNFVTSGAADAETGIEAALRDVPDLIFLDIVLPGMSGFNALRQLRRDPATKEVPIIMISGNVQATEQFYVQRIGADDFMRKPFGRSDVFSRVQRLVESGRLPSHAAPRAELLTDDDSIALPDPVDGAGQADHATPAKDAQPGAPRA